MVETFEREPQMNPAVQADFAMWEQQMEVDQNPAEYLASLPHEGFTPEQHAKVIDQIDAVGMPVDNFTKLLRKANDKGKENLLGSWGIGSDNYGEFSVYERLDREIPEERLGTIVHESAHANSPLVPENAHLFGGEEERQAAEQFAYKFADQTLRTGKYLNGYQRLLAEQRGRGDIDDETFAEESQAILKEMRATNPAHVRQTEEAQRKEARRLRRAGHIDDDYELVNLMSRVGEDGEVELDGVDIELIALTRGVSNYEELEAHLAGLKTNPAFYSEASQAIAAPRIERQRLIHVETEPDPNELSQWEILQILAKRVEQERIARETSE